MSYRNMAKRLALIEKDYLQRLKDKSDVKTAASNFKNDKTESEDVKIYGIPEKKDDEYITLIDLFPLRLQTKVRLLLHYLKDVKLDNQGRVIYPDGVIGSYLI